MFDLIIRNITQRKFRTGLTVFGISLGIFAVMVMGGMSEYFNRHVENTLKLVDKIQVVPDTGIMGGSIDESKVRKVNRVPGVSDAYGLLWMPYDVEGIGLIGDYVVGIPPDKQELTSSDYDNIIGIPLDTAQKFYDLEDTVSYIWVVPDPYVDGEDLAKRIELSVEKITAISPQQLKKQVEGMIGGWIFIYYMNEYLSSMGMVLFAITPRLILISILFATILGTISGSLPAYRAAKMNPMEAMKYG